MEALWKFEEKSKLTMREAIVVLVCTASAVILLCAAMILKRHSRGKQIADAEWTETAAELVQSSCNRTRAKINLLASFCWSCPTRWEEERQPPLLLVGKERSHNAAAPVWQRPILMGEKCQLPRFSGLILYDERGQLLRDAQQEKPDCLVRTTLRDLL